MNERVYAIHRRLKYFPPAQLFYILFARLGEQGIRPTYQWIQDKLYRRFHGYSPPELSQVQPLLFVGGQHSRRGLAAMEALGIGAVVNLREESDDAARGAALQHYLWLPTTDDDPPSLEDLHRGVEFIREQIAAGRGVYIHCASGVGRAPTLAAAYLISTGMSQAEAWEAIMAARPFVRPTPPQVRQIRRFSEAQAASSATQGAAMETDLVQRAYERIMEDEGLTSDLLDDEAEILLRWAEQEIRRLVNQTRGMSEEAAWESLAPKLRYLRKYLRKIARRSAKADNPGDALRAWLVTPDYPDESKEHYE